MSWNSRRAIFVLLILIVAVSSLWLDQGRAQVLLKKDVAIQPIGPGGPPPAADVNPDGFSNGGGVTLPKDDKGRGKTIEAAIDYINDENWAIAIERLQKLLDIDEDVYVRLKRKNAEGKEVYIWVSAKHEANRLVGSLPPAGLDFYKATHGATAAAMLKKAKQNGDPALLAEIMKKYAHTDAGGEAIKLLADYNLDRGNYPSALYCYTRLLSRQGADKLPVEVIAKAWSAACMSPTSEASASTVLGGNVLSAKELWKQLHERARELKFGEQAISLEEFEEYVAKLDRPNFNLNATDAIVFRATANRGNQLVGGPAFMSAKWREPMLRDTSKDNPAAASINRAMNWAKTHNQPVISAFSPITVTVTKGEKKVPLLIYKNYWGLMARNLKSGALEWASPSNWGLERLLRSGNANTQQPMTQWLSYYVDQNQYPQIVFENSTVGTLSTDGRFVYVVDDLAVPPPPTANVNMGFNPNGNGNTYTGDIQKAIAHSQLQIFDLKTNGKLVADMGSSDEKGPLSECYFLGPPLPLGGKLYVLTEKQQELRLVCFEMAEVPTNAGKPIHVPRIVSTQTLGTATDKMEHGVIRRTTAAHLAYGEGILVCPTNSGAVFGINLLENSLVWAYPYREKSDQPQPQLGNNRLGMGRRGGAWIQGPDGRLMMPLSGQENHWKGSAPVVSDGKVVFTAPDARSLHCINLRDGSLVWRKPKLDDDLYLGNVTNGKVLVVGKKNVRGLSLATGETLYTLDTGVPSGQGIGSDNIYYLPLKEAGRGKEPQIVGIDMDTGKMASSSKSRPRTPNSNDLDVPGNLLFYEGDVISLTPEEIVAYPQLKVKIAQMDDLIAKNPNDPIGLTERGDLRLDKGDLAGAIEDLSIALKNNPDKETRARARGKLYDTLTVYISDHFNDAEKYLQEYEDLCKVDMEGADDKQRVEREAEQRRRRATYLWLVGKGREEQGRLVEAFEKYQQFGTEAAGKDQELVPAVDERQVKAAPDVWSRGRIIAMMAKAKPEHREPLEKLIADKWGKLRETNDLKELRQFVRMFGSVSAAGKEARLQLVDRLMDQKDSADEHPLLEAELELNQFRTGQHSPELAARATEALARLYTRKGLLEDAAYCYRKLGGEYAKIPIRDGKTGRQIYDDEAATDKRLLPYLDETDPLGSVKLKAKKETDNYSKQMPGHGRLFQFEHSGEKLPFFRQHMVGLTLDPNHEFKLLDRTQEDDNKAPREIWSQKLSATMFQMLTNQVLGQANNGNPNINNPNHRARFPYRTVGHLIVLPVGHMIYGIDPVNRRVLWEKNLSAGGTEPHKVNAQQPNGPMWNQQPVVDPRDGSVLLSYQDNWAQRLGQAGPLEGQTICVQTRDTLTALDPLSGRTLWSRTDVSPRNYIFADEDHVFVVELDNSNNPHASRVFRATDGISVKAPDFAPLFQKRLQVFGRHILVTEAGASNTVIVRLYDALTGQDAWKQTYPSRSLVTHSEDPHFTAIVEPDGKVHVVDLRARKEVMAGQMMEPAEHLRNVQSIHLLLDHKNFYLACHAPVQVNNGNPFGGVAVSNVMTHLGMRAVPVNGRLYAFERATGEVAWHAEAKNQMLVLDRFEDLPIVLLTARHMVMTPGRGQQSVAAILSIEKRSGLTLFGTREGEELTNAANFFGVHVDARAGAIDFLSQNMKLTHFPAPLKADKAGKSDAAKTSALPGAQAPATPNEGRGYRRTLERVRIREIADPLPGR